MFINFANGLISIACCKIGTVVGVPKPTDYTIISEYGHIIGFCRNHLNELILKIDCSKRYTGLDEATNEVRLINSGNLIWMPQ